MSRIAFYTFGIMREKGDYPQVREFIDRIDHVFSAARSSEGFLDLDDGSWGSRDVLRFFDKEKHADEASTLSLWRDLESVCAFAYRNGHGDALKFRVDWFVKPEWPTYAAWWVDDEHIPTREEACKRLEQLHDNGSDPFAFNFKKPFDKDGQAVELNKQILDEQIKANEEIK